MKNAEKPEFDVDFSLAGAAIDFNLDAAADQPEENKKRLPPGEETGIGTRNRIVTKARRRKFYDLSNVKNAVALIKSLPAKGETVHAVMGGDFASWDLIPTIHQMLGRPIETLHITTLGFNSGNNQHLCDMLDAGTVKKVFLVCSTYLQGADPQVFNVAVEKLTQRGQRILATRNHSKIILIAPHGTKDRFTFESSANLRSCNNLEQFSLTNDRALYEFHRAWIEKLFAE